MTTGTWGWLILAFPLAGTIVIALGWRGWAGRSAGWMGSLAIALAFASSVGAFVSMMAKDLDQRSVVSSAFDYIHIARVHVSLGGPIAPLSVFMCLTVT